MTIREVRLSFAAVILVTVIAAGVVWQYRPVSWSPETQITVGQGDSRIVDVSADPSGEILHLVWEDDREGTMQVFYKRSLDDGLTWDADLKLTTLTPQTAEPLPRVASNGKQVIVFFSNRTGTGEHLFYAVSSDDGSSFSAPIQLTNDPGDQTNPAAAFSGRTLNLVWQSYLKGRAHISYLRSLDAGSTWQPEVALAHPEALDRHPSIFTVDKKVFVVWSRNLEGQEAIFSRASYDSGATWQPEVQLSSYDIPVFLAFPSVASNGTHVHVVWNGKEVLYSRSQDSGATWDRPIPITDRTKQYLAPEISVRGSHVQVVTAAIKIEGEIRHLKITSDVYYLQSPDSGNEWTEPVPLTTHGPEVLSLAPAITVRGDATFIAWQDNRNGPFRIFLISDPDFDVLNSYERKLVIPALVTLASAVVIYTILELKRPGKLKHRARRARRRRRKRSARRRKTIRRE